VNKQLLTVHYLTGGLVIYECDWAELDDSGSFLVIQEEENVVVHLNTRNIVKYVVAKVPDAPGL
jgi:hypothetical protein